MPPPESPTHRRRWSDPPSRAAFFNRELSWLAFNRRVLEQAQVDRHPLLERLRFLAIVASNLDEFFEIRVAGLLQQVEGGAPEISIDGLGPREVLRRIHLVVASMVDHMYALWQDLRTSLAAEKVVFRRAGELTPAEELWVRDYFRKEVYPMLTPLAIDPAHPFPHIANKALNVLCSLNKPETPETEQLMAVVPVPPLLPRIVRIGIGDPSSHVFIFISTIIKLGCPELFPGYSVNSAHVFRVTRNSDLYIDDEEAENLLKVIEDELRNLRRGAAVRLEVESGLAPQLLRTLLEHVRLQHEYAFVVDGPLNLQGLFGVCDQINRPDLKHLPFTPAPGSPLNDRTRLFDEIRHKDVLLHHPYESFQPVVDFISEAATDPAVVAIKQTLYRTSGDSPIVRALIDAARRGKQVTALIELKARFDEANNIQWARAMEEAGVHVVYGQVGFKTHAKLCLVLRREPAGLRAYAHLGTGNYNPKTARIYTDLSYFTARKALTSEVAHLFNGLTGYGRCNRFRRLLVAPYDLHERIQKLILAETRNARRGRPAKIIAKVNSLVDRDTILNLYTASRAGVQVDLIVRGICALVPGVRGLSENIRVRSIVGRFLEHSRIYYFENGGRHPHLLAGSADWMPRNFFRRVEVVFPIEDTDIRQRVLDEILAIQLDDNVDARLLQPGGGYIRPRRPKGRHAFSSQEAFIDLGLRKRGQQG